MICWRVVALYPAAREDERGGMLWFPRELQGEGRYDNPDLYGCLYTSEEPSGAICERLAPFRGAGALRPSMLRRGGRKISLGAVALADDAVLVDLDDPRTLVREDLRPSRVATRQRSVTQGDAARLHRDHVEASGIRWWSTIESSLANITLFDRAAGLLSLEEERELAVDDRDVQIAAELLGLMTDLTPPRSS